VVGGGDVGAAHAAGELPLETGPTDRRPHLVRRPGELLAALQDTALYPDYDEDEESLGLAGSTPDAHR